MNDKQIEKIKTFFEKGKYDNIIYIIDNDLVDINLNSYDEFCRQILRILSEVRINRLIEVQEEFYPYEELFANDFYRSISNAIKRNDKVDELQQEDFEKLKKYYLAIKNIGSYMSFLGEEDENDKGDELGSEEPSKTK